MIHITHRPKKRLFLTLILASLVLASITMYGLWMITLPGLGTINQYLPLFLGLMLAGAALMIAFGVIGIILAIIGVRTLPVFQGMAWFAINLLFPLAIQIGRVFDVNKERVERSFIEVSNHLVKQKRIQVKPEKLLILTPHCLQWETCPHKITRDVSNCKRCGHCQVGDLLRLSDTYGVKVAVVTGGTLARKVIKGLRPQAVLAIACERDLTSGIQDVFPMPVIGILNERPFGPCCNTKIDITLVERAVLDFIS